MRPSDGAGLYLHVPFCRRVCPYCDFAVRTGDRARRQRFVQRLLDEIALAADWPLELDTIYFGGGTPSSLEAEELARLVEALRGALPVARGVRIFLEVNPEDVTAETAAAWHGVGVGTLSLGVQAFDDDALVFLGRQHDSAAAHRAVELALAAGFDTVSLDLIYALPGQTRAAWIGELDAAVAHGVQHLSCYPLTIHERTRFGLLAARGELRPMPEDAQGELFRATHRHLRQAGLPGYEVSNFAAELRHRSRHNAKYWSHTPYLGLGPSAHSFRGRRRWWNLRRSGEWEARILAGRLPVEGAESLDDRTLALEALLTGFRTAAGVDLEALRRRFGVDLLAAHAQVVERLLEQGLVRLSAGRLAPTLEGLAVADALPLQFDL